MMEFRAGQQVFYVQSESRAVWHIETPGDAELMLCGERISVDSDMAKVQYRPGPKSCLWCQHKLKLAMEELGLSFVSSFQSILMKSDLGSKKESPESTTATGPTS